MPLLSDHMKSMDRERVELTAEVSPSNGIYFLPRSESELGLFSVRVLPFYLFPLGMYIEMVRKSDFF